MRQRVILTAGIALLLLEMASSSAATRYAGEILYLGVGARSLGMGSAFVALSDDATAGYWNASGLSHLKRREAAVMHAERFGGMVNYDFIGLAWPLQRFGGVGVSLIRVGVDDIKFTELENPQEELSPFNRPVVSEVVSNADYVLYLSAGRPVRDQLSVGGSLKLIRRKIGRNTAFGYGIDLGARYAPFHRVTFGLNLRDLISTPIMWDTGTTDRVRPSVSMGAAYTYDLPKLRSRWIGAVTSTLGGTASSADQSGALDLGVEYWYQDQVALRAGAEESRLTLGAGLRPSDRIEVDLAYLRHEELDSTYRISASFRF